MNNKILFGIGGMVIGAILVLSLGSTGQYRSMMFSGDNVNNLSSGQIGRRINPLDLDQHFIEQMVPHHDGAIAMAKLAPLKATRFEIKTLAKTIIEAQDKEIKEMRDWYKDWFNKEVPETIIPMMGGGMMSMGGMHMGGQEDITALEKAVDFDKAFIEGMIPHHQLAIMMAQMMKAGTNRPEMLTLANNIIESQSKEITEMQSWYKDWYK